MDAFTTIFLNPDRLFYTNLMVGSTLEVCSPTGKMGRRDQRDRNITYAALSSSIAQDPFEPT